MARFEINGKRGCFLSAKMVFALVVVVLLLLVGVVLIMHFVPMKNIESRCGCNMQLQTDNDGTLKQAVERVKVNRAWMKKNDQFVEDFFKKESLITTIRPPMISTTTATSPTTTATTTTTTTAPSTTTTAPSTSTTTLTTTTPITTTTDPSSSTTILTTTAPITTTTDPSTSTTILTTTAPTTTNPTTTTTTPTTTTTAAAPLLENPRATRIFPDAIGVAVNLSQDASSDQYTVTVSTNGTPTNLTCASNLCTGNVTDLRAGQHYNLTFEAVNVEDSSLKQNASISVKTASELTAERTVYIYPSVVEVIVELRPPPESTGEYMVTVRTSDGQKIATLDCLTNGTCTGSLTDLSAGQLYNLIFDAANVTSPETQSYPVQLPPIRTASSLTPPQATHVTPYTIHVFVTLDPSPSDGEEYSVTARNETGTLAVLNCTERNCTGKVDGLTPGETYQITFEATNINASSPTYSNQVNLIDIKTACTLERARTSSVFPNLAVVAVDLQPAPSSTDSYTVTVTHTNGTGPTRLVCDMFGTCTGNITDLFAGQLYNLTFDAKKNIISPHTQSNSLPLLSLRTAPELNSLRLTKVRSTSIDVSVSLHPVPADEFIIKVNSVGFTEQQQFGCQATGSCAGNITNLNASQAYALTFVAEKSNDFSVRSYPAQATDTTVKTINDIKISSIRPTRVNAGVFDEPDPLHPFNSYNWIFQTSQGESRTRSCTARNCSILNLNAFTEYAVSVVAVVMNGTRESDPKRMTVTTAPVIEEHHILSELTTKVQIHLKLTAGALASNYNVTASSPVTNGQLATDITTRNSSELTLWVSGLPPSSKQFRVSMIIQSIHDSDTQSTTFDINDVNTAAKITYVQISQIRGTTARMEVRLDDEADPDQYRIEVELQGSPLVIVDFGFAGSLTKLTAATSFSLVIRGINVDAIYPIESQTDDKIVSFMTAANVQDVNIVKTRSTSAEFELSLTAANISNQYRIDVTASSADGPDLNSNFTSQGDDKFAGTFNGLLPNTRYTYTIRAVAFLKDDTASDDYIGVLHTVEMPSDLEFSEVSSDSVTLTWSAGTDASEKSFRVSIVGVETKLVKGEVTVEFTGLKPSTSYTASVVLVVSSTEESDPLERSFNTKAGTEGPDGSGVRVD